MPLDQTEEEIQNIWNSGPNKHNKYRRNKQKASKMSSIKLNPWILTDMTFWEAMSNRLRISDFILICKFGPDQWWLDQDSDTQSLPILAQEPSSYRWHTPENETEI